MHEILSSVCSSLIGVGALFVYITLRSRFDRSYLLFGIAMILLCLFCGLDIWVKPMLWDYVRIKAQHVIVPFLPVFLLWHVMELAGGRGRGMITRALVVAACFSVGFAHNVFFTSDGGKVSIGPLYLYLFAPYIVTMLIFLNGYTIAAARGSEGDNKRILLIHLVGFTAISVGGLTDMIFLVYGFAPLPVDSYMIFGVLTYGLVMVFVFSERLLKLNEERMSLLTRLRTAFAELAEANALKELGQSTAIVNHELKNYLYTSIGLAKIARRKTRRDPEVGPLLKNLYTSLSKTWEFTQAVLELSKSRRRPEPTPLNIRPLIDSCLSEHFQAATIRLAEHGNPTPVYAEPVRIERAMLNLLHNCFDAKATGVDIRITYGPSCVVIAIEDDGTGIEADTIHHMFEPFFTTHSTKSGTGLGLSIAKGVVESHGGHIRAYTKNRPGSDSHGLLMIITLKGVGPIADNIQHEQPKVLVVKDGFENTHDILRAIENIFCTSILVEAHGDMRWNDDERLVPVMIASSKHVNTPRDMQRVEMVVLDEVDGGFRTVPEGVMFTEELLLSRLIHGALESGHIYS
jgi:signal transduction histidine kinase